MERRPRAEGGAQDDGEVIDTRITRVTWLPPDGWYHRAPCHLCAAIPWAVTS
jgi:hypothetical protein